jgi:hypothetical protein
MRCRRAWCLVVLTAGLAGCQRTDPLEHTLPSAEALGGAVLEALARRDTQALHALALTEREFRDHVWPDLPAARPERNLPFSYVWGDLRQKSDQALQETLGRVGGTSLTMVAVTFAGETTRYHSYRVHRDTTLRVRDAGGRVHDLRVFGAALEKDGAWKVFSYVVDD